MSEGDVSLIHDEDLLRRMWQQTEDFSRKKEIRAHMYRLREERLRNLYSPEPTRDGKGSEFTATQDHVKSFADQSFQSMKSKEVRDAGSPPKEFTYRGQDLKALSNAGWNVEQENKTTDDGHTHVKSVNANIEGRYDVDGGKGQFAAVDHHKEAVTEYHDDNSSLKRNETSSNTAAREHVVRKTDDGTQISSTTSSSTSTSKFQQMSSTRQESVPYITNDDYDLRSYDTNRNEDASSVTRRQIIKTNDYEKNLRSNDYEQSLKRNDYEQTVRRNDNETGELVSRKIDYPDDNTRVIVETRCLPDGTRVTSTKREFRAPVQSTRSEQSYQTRSENKSYSTQQRSDLRDSSRIIRHVIDNRDNRSTDIVDSQRNVDDYDFKRQIADYTKDTDDVKHYETKVNKKVIDHSKFDDDYSNVQRVTKINRSVVDHAKSDDDYTNVQRYNTTINKKITDNTKIDDDYSKVQRQETKVNQRVTDHSKTDDDYNQTTRYVTRTHKVIESADNDEYIKTHRDTNQRCYETNNDRREILITRDAHSTEPRDYKDVPITREADPRETQPRDGQPKGSQPRDSLPRDGQPRSSQPRDSQPRDSQPRDSQLRDSQPWDSQPRDSQPRDSQPRDSQPRDSQPRDSQPRDTEPRGYQPRDFHPRDYEPRSAQPGETQPRGSKPRETQPRDAEPEDTQPRDTQPKYTQTRDTEPRITDERIHKITRDRKVEEIVEKKTNTEQYQTTYNTDYSQKKISNDWSPSHTAWASTLRADTPSTPRPSTRASSPGSRTFKSSTSSLRSSVSPDKTHRKPSSRGGSPSKIDRYSPTRTISDKHSTTHSTHSVTEVKSQKYSTADDRRPPSGRSPTRPGYSPERKPQDHRQRPSASPEKRPHDLPLRPSASPDRKPTQKTPTDSYPKVGSPTRPLARRDSPSRSRESPERKLTQPVPSVPGYPSSPNKARESPEKSPASRHPKESSVKSSQSPDRKPGYEKSGDGRPDPSSDLRQTTSPTRPYQPTGSSRKPGTSPNRKPGYPSSPTTDKPSDKQPKDSIPNRGSVSPDRKPGYMRPTATSQPSDDLVTPVKPSPTKHVPSPTSTRKPQDHTTTISKIQEDHYKFIDEETKMYTPGDKTRTDLTRDTLTGPRYPTQRDKSPSPSRKAPTKESDDVSDVPRRRSPSPKQHVTITDQIHTTVKTTDVTDNVTNSYRTPNDKDVPCDKTTTPREQSPSKFGTYDKKKPYTEDTTEVSFTSTTDTKDVKYDSLTSREKSPRKTPEQPASPTKKAPERAESPFKRTPDQPGSPTKKTTEQPLSPNKKTPEQPMSSIKKVPEPESPIKKTPEQIGSPIKKAPEQPASIIKKMPEQPGSPTKRTSEQSGSPTKKTPEQPGSPTKRTPEQSGSPTKKTPEQPGSPIKKTPEQPGSPTKITPEQPTSPIKKAPEQPMSPTKKAPRDSVSPIKDTKYKHTTDFLTTERTTEDFNKKTTKEHPRKLITPSSSPSRRPKKPTDTEPSTGQSSPTTSVSGFVYFSSPRTEKTVVTDLDDQELYTEHSEMHSIDDTTTYKRPESLDVRRSPSPSKIPCRSPSPEKRTSPTNSLPRKSSLKKPSTDITQASPVEKPPSSFRVSPTEEPKEFPEHKVVKKDRPGEPDVKAPIKAKPPLERRETYEDRCRKILGMTEDTTETVKKQTPILKEPEANLSSPSISPCRSPIPRDTPFEYPSSKKVIDTKVHVTDFITREQENIIKTTTTFRDDKPADKEPKLPRDSSPTKLKDIITKEKILIERDMTTGDVEETDVKTRTTTKYSSPRQSPERKPSYEPSADSPKRTSNDKPKSHEGPERPGQQNPKDVQSPRSTSPSKPHPGGSPRSNLSPERKPGFEPTDKIQSKVPKDETTSYTETTTTVSRSYDEAKDTEEITVTTKAKDRKPSRSTESPTRKIPDTKISRPSYPSDKSPQRKRQEPKRSGDKYPREDSPTRPVYLESTTSMVAEYGSIEDLQETLSETIKTRHPTSRPGASPTRKLSKPTEESPTKPGHPSKSPIRKPSYEQPSKVGPEKKPGDKPRDLSPTKPGYIKTTVSSKHDTTEDLQQTSISESIRTRTTHSRQSESPTRKTPKKPDDSLPKRDVPSNKSPDRRTVHEQHPTSKETYLDKKPGDKHPEDSSPTRTKPEKIPGYMKTTESVSSKYDTTSEDFEEITAVTITERHHPSRLSESPTRKTSKPDEYPQYPRGDTVKSPHHKPSVESVTTRESPEKQIPVSHSSPHPERSPSRQSPERKPGYQQPSEPIRKPIDKLSKEPSPSRQTKTPYTPGYVKTTTSKYDTTEGHDESTYTKTVQTKQPSSRPSDSPTRKTPKRDDSPRKLSQKDHSPDRKVRHEGSPSSSPERRPSDRYPKDLSPTRQTTGYMNTTTSVTSKHDTHTEDMVEDITSLTIESHRPSSRPMDTLPTQKVPKHAPEHPRTDSPTKPRFDSPSKMSSTPKDSSTKKPGDKRPEEPTLTRPSSSPDRKPGYMRPTASITSKHDTTTEDVEIIEPVERYPSPRPSVSPSRRSPDEPRKTKPGYLTEPEEPRQLRTPSPTKKTIKVTEVSTDFLTSEREQEVLDRVQKSLRKLSPERKEKSPSRERSPSKTTTSLQDIDITTHTAKTDEKISEEITEFTRKHFSKTDTTRPGKPKDEKPKDQKVPSKPSSRTVSPTKKLSGIVSPAKIDKSTDSPTKPRSISPKKPVSPTERPQSPQVPKASGIKPKEQIPSHLTRKPTPTTLTMTKIEKSVTDLKKTTGITSTTKQNTVSRMTTSKITGKVIQSPTGKPSEPRAPTPKGIRESGIPKKETDTKVTRTVSDITMKSKKTSPTSPQRMKSKPEIQVSDMSTKRPTSKTQKTSLREPQSKLPGKPKSATTLNTPSDEDDIIIDVQQSKSSRENSPDRICPTPVNFGDDVGTPRYPDEVKEPDDEFRRRTYHTIHETESIVDDIVEICEDDELFVKRPDVEYLTEEDESLLSVTDKVTRFTKGIDTKKPKDTTTIFKETEKRVHSDFVEENLKSDECLLSVSEKVNKFAKGPKDTKDKSPARKVFDEYDRNTVYTDDYTKLSVHDKAHMFVETAENVKAPKIKPAPQKVERPDLTNVDEALKSDDCLLSVSDKVHKFVKTAEQFLTENQEVEEKEKKIKEEHDKIMKRIVDDVDDDTYDIDRTTVSEDIEVVSRKTIDRRNDKPSFTKETSSSHPKVREHSSPSLKPSERAPTVKITTLRSSEAVKKAKALFENIASTTQKTKETTPSKTTTKLTDIGVMKKTPKTESTTVLYPSVEEGSPNVTDLDSEVDAAPHHPTERSQKPATVPSQLYQRPDDKPRASPSRLSVQTSEGRRSKSPMRQPVETTTTTKTVLTRYPATHRAESPKQRPEGDKPDRVPGYLRPTKTSQIKEEAKVIEETEVSSRRGSGKFGVELRRTSVERSTVSSERRRSVEHPCIEDIFDLDLLEQMLEKVVGYEQRRRIRAQIRIARKISESDHESTTHTRTRQTVTSTTQKSRSPERHQTKSPDRTPKSTSHKTASPDRHAKTPQRTVHERSHPREHVQPVLNGHTKEPAKLISDKRQRPQSPEKPAPKSVLKTKSPVRQASPDKKIRTQSPNKIATPKPKGSRFNEYASAYMKKVGLSEADKLKFAESKKKTTEEKRKIQHVEEHQIQEQYSTAKHFTERTSSKDVIEVVQMNGSKRSPSPEKRESPDRKAQSPDRKAHSPDRRVYSPDHKAHSPERIYERTPSPVQKQPVYHTRSEPTKKETIIKTVYDIEKKIPQKQAQEDKPSWVTNRNLKKISSESRSFSSKKIEEKPKYRAPSPSKVITKPIDVITSSYGPGPLDADGKPLFGIKALRNGASNYQVKGTVIRQEYHSRNGGEPEGTVSVTAYSTEPEELERLLQRQGEQPSRIHGLAAITTTKKFGGDTGTTLKEIHGKEERAAIEHFTHSDRRVSDTRIEDISESFTSRQEILGESRRVDTRREEIVGDIISDRTDNKTERMQRPVEKVDKIEKKGDRVGKKERPDDKKTVRQSSVKSLTEKYIKSANESSKAERTTYPKAGLILRTATMKDSVSSDSSAHAGLTRTDSEHSLGSVEDTVVTTERCEGGVRTVTTTRTHGHVTHGHTGSKAERDQREEQSFLDSNTKVTGVQDILTRMKNADIVIQEGDTSEDTEARALLNKFLGATVLMAGMQSYVTEKPTGKVVVKQETIRTSSSGGGKVASSQTRNIQEFDVDQCWDERLLRKLLDECNDYEERRRLRARIRTLMAEQEACASAVTEALAAAGEAPEDSNEAREEEEVTVTSSVRRNSSEKTVSSSTTTTKTSKVIESMTKSAPKPVSPFAKFRQLEKQNSTNSPKM